MAPTTPSPKLGGNKKMGIGKVLKTAGRLPKGLKAKGGRTKTAPKIAPLEGELPAVLLRIQIVGCKNLLAADRNGKSDP